MTCVGYMKIPFKKLNIDDREINAVTELMRTGMIGLGEKVFEFEKALAEYVGAKYVVATDSCTSALFLSLKYKFASGLVSRGVRPTILIPTSTVPLVADAILEAGFEPYLQDEFEWIGSEYSLRPFEIYDSAHQLSKDQCKDQPGTRCFSFYPTKPIGSADGGAIATNDKDFYEWARSVSLYGRNQTNKYGNSWDFEVERVGYKRHMSNLQAAICLGQLKKLPETDKRRSQIRDRYNQEFGYNNTSLYLYRINVKEREKFIEKMAEAGIECGVHFKPLHLMKAFKEFATGQEFPKAEGNYNQTVSLPFYDTMTDAEVEFVITKTKELM